MRGTEERREREEGARTDCDPQFVAWILTRASFDEILGLGAGGGEDEVGLEGG